VRVVLWAVTADVTRNATSSTVDNAVAARLVLSTLNDGPDKLRLIERRSVRKTSVVGSSVVLDCDVPPPPPATDKPTRRRRPGASEYMVKWHKQGIEVPIYIQLDRLPAHVDANYHGRARLLADPTGGDDASLEISDVRLTDEGWYECAVVFIGSADDPTANGTWVYLAVTGQSPTQPVVLIRCRKGQPPVITKDIKSTSSPNNNPNTITPLLLTEVAVLFLPRNAIIAMPKRGLCRRAVSVHLFVCSSRLCIRLKRMNISSKYFHGRVATLF